MANKNAQSERFREVAPKLECGEDETRREEKLKIEKIKHWPGESK
ncbi:hypothetical protein [Sphingomonas sp.]|nr:hypothetical protein [Sphingomonas sp.]